MPAIALKQPGPLIGGQQQLPVVVCKNCQKGCRYREVSFTISTISCRRRLIVVSYHNKCHHIDDGVKRGMWWGRSPQSTKRRPREWPWQWRAWGISWRIHAHHERESPRMNRGSWYFKFAKGYMPSQKRLAASASSPLWWWWKTEYQHVYNVRISFAAHAKPVAVHWIRINGNASVTQPVRQNHVTKSFRRMLYSYFSSR